MDGSHAPSSPQQCQGVLLDVASPSSLAEPWPLALVSTAVRYNLIPLGIS